MKNTIIAFDDNAKFLWIKVKDDKWVEQFWKKDNAEWVHIHDVRYMTTDQVERFMNRLSAEGFIIIEGGEGMEELQKEVERLTELNDKLKAENAEMSEIIIRLKAELYDYMSM